MIAKRGTMRHQGHMNRESLYPNFDCDNVTRFPTFLPHPRFLYPAMDILRQLSVSNVGAYFSPNVQDFPKEEYDGLEFRYGRLTFRPAMWKFEGVLLSVIALYFAVSWIGSVWNSKKVHAWYVIHSLERLAFADDARVQGESPPKALRRPIRQTRERRDFTGRRSNRLRTLLNRSSRHRLSTLR